MVRFAVKIAGKTGKRKLRSGRGDAGIGFAARKQAEMDLRMQRSGQERAVVGFTTWGTGTNRDGRTGTEQETHGICEADGETLGYASLYGNRQKWTCGCSEADRRGLLWASLRRERGQAETEGREQGKRRTGSAKRTRRRWDTRRCSETG